MLTILIGLVLGAAAFAAGVQCFGWGSGLFLGLVGLVVPCVLIFRRVNRRVQTQMKEVERLVGAGQPERAIDRLEALRWLGRWQILLGPTIDAQIGMLRYAHIRDFERAKPYLERAAGQAWQAKLMLAAFHFRKQRYDEMVRVFERAVRRSRKEGLFWLTYAWCEWKRGQGRSALSVLARARKELPRDERLVRMQEALQNGGKPKTRSFGPEWPGLYLEEMPRPSARPPGITRLPPRLLRRAGVRMR